MKVVRMAFRQYWWAVGVIIGLVLVTIVVSSYILVQQRLPLPFQDAYTLKTEFTSAQAFSPGQGQNVTVAGVPVGEVSKVELKPDGRAEVDIRMRGDKLAFVHRDATLMVRPRTALQDLSLALDPGTPGSPKLGEKDVLSAGQTKSQVQFDEVLSSLDTDTRGYIQQLLAAGSQTTAKKSQQERIRSVLRAGTPTLKQADKTLQIVRDNRRDTQELVTKLGDLSTSLAQNDDAIGNTLNRASTTLKTFADRDGDLQNALRQLPPTLNLVSDTLTDTGTLADNLQPTATALRPAVTDLNRVLPRVTPLLREIPGDLKPLRKLARTGREPVRQVRTALHTLVPQLPELGDTFRLVQNLTNVLGYEPPGSDRSYLFWTAWLFHNGNSFLGQQDANGTTWRVQPIVACGALTTLGSGSNTAPIVDLLTQAGVCNK